MSVNSVNSPISVCPQIPLYHLAHYPPLHFMTAQHTNPSFNLFYKVDHYPIIIPLSLLISSFSLVTIQSPNLYLSSWPLPYHPISSSSLVTIPSPNLLFLLATSHLFFQPGHCPIIQFPLSAWSPFHHAGSSYSLFIILSSSLLLPTDHHPIIQPSLPAWSSHLPTSCISFVIIPSYASVMFCSISICPSYLFSLLAFLSIPPSNLVSGPFFNLSIHSLDFLNLPLFIFHYHYSPTIHPSTCWLAHHPSFPGSLLACSLFLYLSPICNISQVTPCTNTVYVHNYTSCVLLDFSLVCTWFYSC